MVEFHTEPKNENGDVQKSPDDVQDEVPELPKPTNFLSSNHTDPNRGAAAYVRRRSSAQIMQQLGQSRRLSAISSHSLALALEVKRKSAISLKSNLENVEERDYQDSQDSGDSQANLETNDEVYVMSVPFKIIYSTVMLLIHFNFGLSYSGFAPTFVDFKFLVKTTMTFIGLIPIFQAVGGVCGSLCGTLYRWLPRQIILLIVVSFMGFSTIFMPYSKEIYHLYICIFFFGFGVGAWNNSNNVWLMEMWQENSASVLLFSQAIYGVGTIVGPLVVRPYLTGEFEGDLDDSGNSTSHDELAQSISHKLKTPFLIDGCIVLLGSVLMLLLYFIKPYKYTSVTKIAKEMATTPEEKARLEEAKRVIPKKTIIFCVSIFFAFGFMTENMYMDFAPTFFQFVPLRLPAPTAAEIASTMAIALTAGRGLCMFLALKVPTQYLIMSHVCIIWVGVVIQYFSQHHLALLWFSAVLICYGYSVIYVALYAFVNQYFEMTDAVGTIFIASYNSLYLFLPYFIGNNIETFPDIFMYLMFGCVSVAIIDFAILLFRIRNIPKHLIRK